MVGPALKGPDKPFKKETAEEFYKGQRHVEYRKELQA